MFHAFLLGSARDPLHETHQGEEAVVCHGDGVFLPTCPTSMFRGSSQQHINWVTNAEEHAQISRNVSHLHAFTAQQWFLSQCGPHSPHWTWTKSDWSKGETRPSENNPSSRVHRSQSLKKAKISNNCNNWFQGLISRTSSSKKPTDFKGFKTDLKNNWPPWFQGCFQDLNGSFSMIPASWTKVT